MLIAILLVFTPLILFALFDLLTNGSTGTIAGMQELATRPGDALAALLIFALVGSVFVVSQVIIVPFFMRGGNTEAEPYKRATLAKPPAPPAVLDAGRKQAP